MAHDAEAPSGGGGAGGEQQQQSQQQQQPRAQSLRALYQRVKQSPLEVVAIETTGIAPAPLPAPSSSSGQQQQSQSQQSFEEVPLRTRPSLLDRELAAVLAAPPTLEGVHSALERAVLNLRATEAFDDVWAEIDGDPPVSEG